MEVMKKLNTAKIKRRNFFYVLGASFIGIFSFSNLPFKIFTSKVNKVIRDNEKIHIAPELLAVSREKEGRSNG
jgi:hypothetical protein